MEKEERLQEHTISVKFSKTKWNYFSFKLIESPLLPVHFLFFPSLIWFDNEHDIKWTRDQLRLSVNGLDLKREVDFVIIPWTTWRSPIRVSCVSVGSNGN